MGAEITASDAVSFRQAGTRYLAFAVGFFFSFRQGIVLLSVQLFGVEPSTGTAISIALDLLLLSFVCFDSIGAGQRTFRSIVKLTPIRWVLVFLAFSCLSLAWSDTASLSNSLVYWLGLTIDVANVVMLLRRDAGIDDAHALMRGFVWSSCVLAAIAWMMPTAPDLRLGDDELFGANTIGYLFAFAFFFAQYLIREEKKRLMGPAFLLAITLLRTLSKTTIAAFLMSQGLLLLRDKSISRKSKMLITLTTLIVVAVSWNLLSAYYEIYSNAGSQSTTLTGRIGIWEYVLAEAIQQPWVGHGFDSIWKVIPPFGSDQFETAHAHNELLQQFYAYGLVGIGIFSGIYISFYRQIRKLTKGPLRTFFIAFLLFVLVHGTAEAERCDLLLPLWSIVMLSLVIEQARIASGGQSDHCLSKNQ